MSSDLHARPHPPITGTEAPAQASSAHLHEGVEWWPFRAFFERPFDRRALPVWAAWLWLTVLSMALAALEAVSGWTGMPLQVGTNAVGFSVYPPVALSALAVFWLGPAYGASTAYASGLVSGLAGGLHPSQAVFFALGTPAGVLLLWFLVLMLRVRPDMRNYRDWWRFCAAALIAVTASSLDVMLYNEWHHLPLLDGQRLWQGWIFGDTALLCFVVAPVLRFSWRRVHHQVLRRVGAPRRELSATNTVLLLGVVWSTLTGLALLGLRLMAATFELPEGASTDRMELLVPRMREMETFLVVLVGALLLSTMALTAELVSRHEKSVELSLRDALTGAFNRRAFHRLFEREVERSRASALPISLLYFDIDRFKLINDRHGHRMGDGVLVAVTREAEGVLRPLDLLFRWGGDEFVMLLPNTSRDGAQEVATRLRARVEAHVVTPDASSREPVTVSIGVATVQADSGNQSDLIDAADTAVRLAKALGRNRVATDLMVGAPEATGVPVVSGPQPAPTTLR